jgi:hypothetical protein
MKRKVFGVLACMGLTFLGHAKVLTVSNNVASPGQYTVLQTACDAAASNDTIYIHGSESSYGDVNITKPLVLIGTGVNAQKRFKFSSKIKNLNIGWSSNNSQNGGGSKIFGLDIEGQLSITEDPSSVGIKNVLIQRNRISSVTVGGVFTNGCGDPCSTSSQSSNINICNNVIGSCGIYGKSVYIKNNIIGSIYGGFSKYVSTLVVAHNVINYSCNLKRGSIYNNIFFSHSSNVFEACEYTSITRNLVIGKINYTNANIVFGTNTGGENILNEDPLFIDVNTNPISYSYTYPTTGPFADYHLGTGSPAIGAGIGGVDLGIYGGDTPFFEGTSEDGRNRYFPMPAIPVMLDMNIVNSSVLKNGKIKVEFKARKQD